MERPPPYNPGLMRRQMQMAKKNQMQCFSVEDIKSQIPISLMVNPYATRMVIGNALNRFLAQLNSFSASLLFVLTLDLLF